jgi:hypothetical protein
MQINDFRQGNIVLLFEAVTADLPQEAVDWDRLYPSPYPAAAPEYERKYDEFLRGKFTSIEKGHLTFVRMVSSYGADLLAVCESVKMVDC